ncbi:MAG: type II toxin-antitoxin system Phd/YefM family antitoxin [Acidobacteriota bacterium]
MSKVSISVTEAARNFSDCVNRARYQGTSFVLHKNGVPVARIIPEPRKLTTGRDLSTALRDGLEGAHLGQAEASTWLREIEEARGGIAPPAERWPR